MSNTKPDYKNPYFPVAFGTILVGVIITLILVYVSFRKTKSVSCYLVMFAILASLSYILAAAFQTLCCWFHVRIYHNERLGHLYDILEVLFWHLGQLFDYCYLLSRLYIGFRGTQYSLSYQTFMMLFGLIVTYILDFVV